MIPGPETPAAVFDEMRQEDSMTVDDTPEVDVEHPLPRLLREVLHPAGGNDTRIVEYHVYAPEALHGGAGRRREIVESSDVAPHAQHAIPGLREFGLRGPERRLLNVGKYQIHTLGTEAVGSRKAYARRPTGDECRASLKFVHTEVSQCRHRSGNYAGTTGEQRARYREPAWGR